MPSLFSLPTTSRFSKQAHAMQSKACSLLASIRLCRADILATSNHSTLSQVCHRHFTFIITPDVSALCRDSPLRVCVFLQKAPCAIHNPHDDINFTTTQEDQEERISFIASVTDAAIRGQYLNQPDAAKFLLQEVPKSPLVQKALISDRCFQQPAVSQAK